MWPGVQERGLKQEEAASYAGVNLGCLAVEGGQPALQLGLQIILRTQA